MTDIRYRTNVAVVGGGIAGMVTALELAGLGVHVTIFDRDVESAFGGLAKESFGGIFLVDTREQRRLGIRDTPELALEDWTRTGELEEGSLEHRWASAYVENCRADVYDWLRRIGVHFFPVVHWVERGLYVPGNSVPRFHMVWGTGFHLVGLLEALVRDGPAASRITTRFGHRVTSLESEAGRVGGVRGVTAEAGRAFIAKSDAVVVASGGYAGNMSWLRSHWDSDLGTAPETILNGSHQYALGDLHGAVRSIGGDVVHPERVWFYAAGIPHPEPRRPGHGLSIVPPKSALWLDHLGRRIGPAPLVSGFDTRFLVQQICRRSLPYTWQVMNRRIARKELAISGSEYNDAIRDRRLLPFLRTAVFGNEALVRRLEGESEDVVAADSVEGLAERMNALTGSARVDARVLERTIRTYDDGLKRGGPLLNDDQVRRIAHLRRYRGDRTRTCRFQPILDSAAGPLLAIREHILSRKSLGGIRTDLGCRVLTSAEGSHDGHVIPGLYAVGEAAGFGGGGIHGLRSLEGTFLATCMFTGRRAARTIAGVLP